MSTSVYETFRNSAREFPGNAFLCTPDYEGGSDRLVEIGYSEMLARVDATAAAYRAAGYGPKHPGSQCCSRTGRSSWCISMR